MKLPPELLGKLEEAKQAARQLDKRGNTMGEVEIGGEAFRVRPYGLQGGILWVFEDDDLMFKVRSPELPWHVSVRYSAAGLAEHGVYVLRERVAAFFDGWAEPAAELPRVSRADWCYDVFSPALTEEMDWHIPARLVLPSRVKVGEIIGTGKAVQTLYIGERSSPLVIVIYDKGREIRESSGKDWMRELWSRFSTWTPPPRDEPIEHVWRIEVRARRDWLKERRLDHLEDFNEGGISELLTEAFTTRRLTSPNGDGNRARWPLAPLWTLLLDLHPADHMRPLGRRFTMRRHELGSMLVDNAVGTLRSAHHLLGMEPGEVYDEAALRRDQDDQYELKLRRAAKRYAGIDEAR